MRGARLPRVPRRLRHRDEPPRLQDPLQDPERRPAHARRARLRAVGRHGGASSARAALPLVSLRERAAAARLRRRRLLAPVRAHVHEHPHDARPRRHPAARRAIAARTIRSSSPAARPRRTPSRSRRSSTRSSSATARSARPRSRSRGRALKRDGRAARRAPRRARRACAGVYVPVALRDARRRRHRASTVVDRALGRRRAAARSSARSSTTSTSSRSRTTAPIGGPEAIFDRMSIEIARGCTEGCRFCQAGMIYRPVRERDPEQIVETVRQRREEERLRRGRASRRSRPPTTRASRRS